MSVSNTSPFSGANQVPVKSNVPSAEIKPHESFLFALVTGSAVSTAKVQANAEKMGESSGQAFQGVGRDVANNEFGKNIKEVEIKIKKENIKKALNILKNAIALPVIGLIVLGESWIHFGLGKIKRYQSLLNPEEVLLKASKKDDKYYLPINEERSFEANVNDSSFSTENEKDKRRRLLGG